MPENALKKLADLMGLVIETTDGYPQYNPTDASLSTLLAGVGIPVQESSEAEEIAARKLLEHWRSTLDPVHVCREKEIPILIPVRFREDVSSVHQWRLTEENGKQHTGEFTPPELTPGSSTYAHDGRLFIERHLAIDLELPCGYHELAIERIDEPADRTAPGMLLAVTPGQCFIPPGLGGKNRIWGMGVHLHAVKSQQNWGIGDFSDLYSLLNWAAEQGSGILATSPLYDMEIIDSHAVNPYRPSCRSLLNVLFIDPEAIPELKESEEAVTRRNEVQFQARLSGLQAGVGVDHHAVYRAKDEILRLIWQHFAENHLNPDTDRGKEFRHFQHRGGERLYYFGIFSAIRRKAENGPNAAEWPEEFRNPQSRPVREFAEEHPDEIEYYQFLQWQAEVQLSAVGRRSMELGLKVGLLQEFLFAPSPSGFEAWYYRDFFNTDASLAVHPLNSPVNDPAAGLSLFMAESLKKFRYQPFIENLRHTMQYSGGLLMRNMSGYYKTYFTYPEQDAGIHTAAYLPFRDILGIIALESQRNNCMIIADDSQLLPKEMQLLLEKMNIFSNLSCCGENNLHGSWLRMTDYPEKTIIKSSPYFSTSLKGFWTGRDIAAKTETDMYRSEFEQERSIVARSSDRAHLLISLNHAGLLPEGYHIDPGTIKSFDHELITALQIFLVRTAAKIFIVSMNDLLELDTLLETPGFSRQKFWVFRYPAELEKIQQTREYLSLFQTFCRERGIGVTRPSAPAFDRKKGMNIELPSSFYRLQLSRNFTFTQAIEIIPYLKEMGISHCYVSPLLMARPGSSHGYDIIDHNRINPEIGSRMDYEHFVAALEENGMAMILDMVPNHMGVGSDNKWWMDVLENGESSQYADYFDINWNPQQQDLAGRVLLPVLGDHYGTVLDSGRLTLHFQADAGSLTVRYYENTFPVDPKTYPLVLGLHPSRLEDRLGWQHNGLLELQNLVSSFENLPGREEKSENEVATRRRNKEINKRILARLCREYPEIKQFIEENIILFNGEPGKSSSYDQLHNLLENQAYRLAYWRVAADEINYRRFFDINDLACLRMEKKEVFHATHGLVLDLIITGKLDGLRIDHPDGLYDPLAYFSWLQAAAAGDLADNQFQPGQTGKTNGTSFYIVVEKILADFEHLPGNWPVQGTTGYDFLNLLNGLFIDPSAEKPMTRIYNRFIGENIHFDELLYNSKRLIIGSLMSGELNVLTTSLYRLAQSDRHTRDFRLNRLREALMEIIACFPVYRTYSGREKINKNDARFIEWAVDKATRKEPFDDAGIYDFIRNILLQNNKGRKEDISLFYDFCMKFQQYTGPVMAKGLEDTSFYIYNRLLSLNEVGGQPKHFGTSAAAFHKANQYRMRRWPHAMLNTSTHDTKRSEDVRARINVLTEMPEEWKNRISQWSRINRSMKTQINNILAPTRNDEYGFYQNLIGIWPPDMMNELEHRELVPRMVEYMIKACREAKKNTSWITPSEPYETAVKNFVEGTLRDLNSPFLHDFKIFHRDVAWFGMLNSISQAFLKLVSPGIPNIYQGNETWNFCLVDPDNRRPVDFAAREKKLLSILQEQGNSPENMKKFLQDILESPTDGRIKMFTIMETLRARNEWKNVFEKGSYLPLTVEGGKKNHLCAFARYHEGRIILAAAPRLYCRLMHGSRTMPLDEDVWQDTQIMLPDNMAGIHLKNVYSGEITTADTTAEGTSLNVADVLRCWPVGLLRGTADES